VVAAFEDNGAVDRFDADVATAKASAMVRVRIAVKDGGAAVREYLKFAEAGNVRG
jgi:hypothetical protein